MTDQERLDYATHRIASAYDTFKAARVLADNSFWNSAVNRLYYAVFYAVNALLVLNNIQAQSHSGIRGQFSLHFIKTNQFDKKYGKLFAQLYDWRQKGDYANIVDFDAKSVESLFDPVKGMIDKINSYINSDHQC